MSVLGTIEIAPTADSIAVQVVERLRHAIVTMRIRPGEKLSEQDIATRLGVSRQPVREAFIKLAEAGLVRILPQRGTMVVKISVEAVENARFIRTAIESAVVREAAERRDLKAIALARRIHEDVGRAVEAANSEQMFALDEAFHQALAAAAGRRDAWRVIEEQKAQMDRVRYLDIADAVPMRTVLAQHEAILVAVEAGDPEEADRAMRVHLHQILVSLPKLAARWPGLFELGSGSRVPG